MVQLLARGASNLGAILEAVGLPETDEREVTEIDGTRIAPYGIKVGNPAFDVTPHRYVTGIVTENGIAYPPFDVSLKRVVKHSTLPPNQ